VKIMCPHGHRIGDVRQLDSGQWVIDLIPDESMMLGQDGRATLVARYPAREPLHARPRRMLACPRECMRVHSWYAAESAELERLAATGIRTHRLTGMLGSR
jgi:hypothetical protein